MKLIMPALGISSYVCATLTQSVTICKAMKSITYLDKKMRLKNLWLALSAIAVCTAAVALEQPELQWPIKRIGVSKAIPHADDALVKLRAVGSEWVVDQDASINQPDVEQLWFRGNGRSG